MTLKVTDPIEMDVFSSIIGIVECDYDILITTDTFFTIQPVYLIIHGKRCTRSGQNSRMRQFDEIFFSSKNQRIYSILHVFNKNYTFKIRILFIKSKKIKIAC